MQGDPLDREHFARLRRRLEQVTDTTAPRWGALSAARMLLHLRLTVEASLCQMAVPDRSTWLTRTLFRWLAYHVLPDWPKARIRVPAVYTPVAECGADGERERLLERIDQFLAAADAEPERLAVHELFGPLTLHYWRRVHGIHMDYHLRQFGV